VGTRVYHGLRASGSAPCINYFEVGYIPLHNGLIESVRYQISCRASTPGVTQDLGRKVCVLFHNLKALIGSASTFALQQATVEGKMLLPELDTNLYHVPVDVMFVFDDSTVS